MAEDQEPLTEKYAAAIDALRYKKPTNETRARAVEWQITQELESIEDLLELKQRCALLKAYHGAVIDVDSLPNLPRGTAQRSLIAEIRDVDGKLRELKAEASEMETANVKTLERLHFLWAIQDSLTTPPMVASR